jgi:predicted RNase H-like HicB family nuclease
MRPHCTFRSARCVAQRTVRWGSLERGDDNRRQFAILFGMKRTEAISTLHAQYVCTFRPEKGGGYTVRCTAFPELITNGRTLEEARAAAREAIELCLEVYGDEGRPIPASDGDPHTIIREVVPAKLTRA